MIVQAVGCCLRASLFIGVRQRNRSSRLNPISYPGQWVLMRVVCMILMSCRRRPKWSLGTCCSFHGLRTASGDGQARAWSWAFSPVPPPPPLPRVVFWVSGAAGGHRWPGSEACRPAGHIHWGWDRRGVHGPVEGWCRCWALLPPPPPFEAPQPQVRRDTGKTRQINTPF